MTGPLSPKQLADRAIRELKSIADPRVAAGAGAYFKAYEDLAFFGVKTPAVQQTERRLFQEIRGAWQIQDAQSFCDLLIRKRELEAKLLGTLLFARFRKSFDKNSFLKIEEWVSCNFCSDWAST